ncbi:ABC transporter ATP-binding protein [Leucobacter sp. UT-8R-CII-1-4]|uniref:ABC transporter ATP-binding protein n=1 Tax=Leucobacter sp. UT-8R-CII-1-4 TaxID=3040075 RepID=UPI0024A89665|nr:ABC transporter ATP-binding protein [Leucobacter sp. UT-8R-CII-1-4]MDI6023356.1 ABC transporter ATP-binding protein [Leucobacter sp. UT-8R-CII-1-4]
MNTQRSMQQTATSLNEPAFELSGLTRSFGSGERRVQAVRGVDLSIGRGEIVALLGPNGAGKTTTIDMMLGLSDPDSGSVRVLGQTPRQAASAGRLSALMQTGGLLADLTVAETVEVIASFYGASARVADVMERTGLEPIAKRKVSKCSGGEQQRVKFALALLPDPDVLVLDEPTAGMDVTARRRFWEVMRDEANAGRTIVFATHYLEEAEQFAQRTVVMNHGKIVADGATAQLRAALGGRTVSATLPAALWQLDAKAILDALNLAELTGQPSADTAGDSLGQTLDSNFEIDIDEKRITLRTAHSDAIAARLLELGAHDLEIVAPTLETAFTKLTRD